MDRIKKIIYKKIISKDNSVDFETVEAGINEYIILNGLDVVAEKLSDEVIEKYISAFLVPLDSFSGQMLVEYFNDFSSLSKFKILSNTIYEQAKCKLLAKDVDISFTKKKFDELSAIYTELYKNKTMQQVLDKHFSECKLDLNYVCNNFVGFSIRLNEFNKLTNAE